MWSDLWNSVITSIFKIVILIQGYNPNWWQQDQFQVASFIFCHVRTIFEFENDKKTDFKKNASWNYTIPLKIPRKILKIFKFDMWDMVFLAKLMTIIYECEMAFHCFSSFSQKFVYWSMDMVLRITSQILKLSIIVNWRSLIRWLGTKIVVMTY